MVDNSIPKPMGNMTNIEPNPLMKHVRQPKLYIRLPSNGKYWPEKSLEMTETGELPVLPMTARDEITFKTPDALINGQATVDVIQSCIPSIKNAWDTPSIDLDVILIAIRRATYGDTLEMKHTIPGTDIEKEYGLNLLQMYDGYFAHEFIDTFAIDGFKVQIRPVAYKEFTKNALKTFEEQRILGIVSNDQTEDTEKIKRFQESFQKLTDINIDMVCDSIDAIQPEGEPNAVTNKAHIKQFIEQAESKVYSQIMDHIKEQRGKFNQQPLTFESTKEEKEAGAPETYEIPVTFDQSNFFGIAS